MTSFVALFACNVVLLLLIMRWRGLQSIEGLGIAFVTLMVVSDGLSLLFLRLFEPASAAYATQRMEAEVVPTVIHILGVAIFALGLAVVDPRPARIRRRLTTVEGEQLAVAGAVLAAGGIVMKALALYLWGLRSLSDYLENLYLYDFKIRSYSSLDQGVPLAVLGFIMLAIACEGQRAKQAVYLGAALATAMLLSLSKSGMFLVIVPFYLLATTFSPTTLRTWTRAPVLALTAIIFVVGLGIKTQVKYRGLKLVNLSSDMIVEMAAGTIGARFSGEGLYRKYSYLVTRISDDPTMALHGDATLGIVAGAVPRFVFESFGHEKPPHPFYARGELVQEDRHVDLYANDAPSLIGAAFADAGYLSLFPTMLIGGIFLALLRRAWLARTRHVAGLVSYTYVASQAGPAIAESGFLNLPYFLAWGVLLAAALVAVVWSDRQLAARSSHVILT